MISADASVRHLSGVAGAVPADGIDSAEFDASIGDDGTISGTHTITFTDANTAEGTFEMTKA